MKLLLGTQLYPWSQHYGSQKQNLTDHWDEVLTQIAASGFDAFEYGFHSLEEVHQIVPILRRQKLVMQAYYCGGPLHNEQAAATVRRMVAVGILAAQKTGINTVVVNPDPLDWTQPVDKNDAQLIIQAKALDRVGAGLRAKGIRLAYHTHDTEMRQGAREFHAMMTRTDPKNVGLCLDTHWVYRGAGHSQVALESILALYGSRVRALHLRQSSQGVWTECFGPGDIDYRRIVRLLKAARFKGPITLEQARENGTPRLLSMVESHRRSVRYLRKLFDL
jgi:inosose dehydratase